MRGLKIFKNYIANFLLVGVVLMLGIVGFAVKSVQTISNNNPIFKGSSNTNVALMFNVYWGTEYLPTILDTLEKYDIKTTFFVGGSWVKDNEKEFMQIVNNGHEIGNHGFFHKEHNKLSFERNVQEIQTTHTLVKAICGINMNLFAPPSGAYNDNTLRAASEEGYVTVMWSKDTIDWRDQDSSLIYKRATKNIGGGDLILMHPTIATADALDDIITEIKKQGLNIAPVSDVILPKE